MRRAVVIWLFAAFITFGVLAVGSACLADGYGTKPDAPPGPPDRPLITSPTEYQTVSRTQVVVQWNPVPRATGYQVGVKDPSGATPDVWAPVKPGDSPVTYTIPVLPAGSATIVVRASNYQGSSSDSTVHVITPFAQPDPPALLTPAPDSTVAGDHLTVSWKAAINVSAYAAGVVDVTAQPPKTLFGSDTLGRSATSFTVTNLPPGHRLTVSVAAVNPAGSARSSLSVNVAESKPAAPVLVYPKAEDVVPPGDLELSWRAVAGAKYYRLTVTDEAVAKPFSRPATTTETLYVLSGLVAQHNVGVELAAVNDAGESTTRAEIRVGLPPVGAPDLSPPGRGHVLPPGMLTVSWPGVPGADSYLVIVTDETTGTRLVDRKTTRTGSFRVLGMVAGHQITIAVAAVSHGVETWSRVSAVVQGELSR